jgi:hypothetical protein
LCGGEIEAGMTGESLSFDSTLPSLGVLKVFKLRLESSLDRPFSGLVDGGEFIIDDNGGDIGGNEVELAWRDLDESDVVETRRDWSRFGGGGLLF